MAQIGQHIVLCHGLNNTPAIMRDLEVLFKARSYITHQVILKGHKKNIRQLREEDWLMDIVSMYREVSKTSKNISFCGYSLGCLVHHAASIEFGLTWNKVYYFAPALHFKKRVKLLKILYPFNNFKIPSLTPDELRPHKHIYASYYKCMFRLQEAYCQQHLSVALKVFLSPRDEAISLRKTKKWLKKKDRLIIIKKVKPKTARFYHIITVKKRVVTSDWERIKKELL